MDMTLTMPLLGVIHHPQARTKFSIPGHVQNLTIQSSAVPEI